MKLEKANPWTGQPLLAGKTADITILFVCVSCVQSEGIQKQHLLVLANTSKYEVTHIPDVLSAFDENAKCTRQNQSNF